MFKEVRKKFDIWLWCLKLSIKSQCQYKGAFFLRCIVMFITYFCEFLTTCFLVSKFPYIEGWSSTEIMLTYGLATLAYSIARFLFAGFNNVSRQIKEGSFYMSMIRPFSEKFYLLAKAFPLERGGQFILGSALIIYVYVMSNCRISLIWLIVYVINGVLIYGALFVFSAALAFWVVDCRELMGILTNGTLRAIVYPISIYKKILQELMTYIIPVAFISYYPAMILLNKLNDIKMMVLLPAVGVSAWFVSVFTWRMGIKRYEGSGG